ncbi:MAG: transposase [Blautia wexlerae]
MLKPRDGAEKDEGELTGGKRLIERLRKRHGHFADVIVADALYLNAPFINTIKENGLEAVIRLKDEKRLIFQDAEGFFKRGEGKRDHFNVEKRRSRYGIFQGLKLKTAHTGSG